MPQWEHSLAALGLDTVPALEPLSYPGRPAPGPALLAGEELFGLGVRAGRLGQWTVDGFTGTLDEVLREFGQAPTEERFPVIAVGSNASPAQLAYKFGRFAVPALVPMVPVRVRGVAVGCSAHIGRIGYVASAPYLDPAVTGTLWASWLEPRQLDVVDGTEFPNYLRALLPGGVFEMVLPSGERLAGAQMYAGARGVLADPRTGLPRQGGGDQAELLAELLAGSARLRTLFGPGPADWVARAGRDPHARAEGTRVFAEEGWAVPQPTLAAYTENPGPPPTYAQLPPLDGSFAAGDSELGLVAEVGERPGHD
ncbi:hypothetical protein HUT18_25350 [Streptomyces sp. NA04227]|uniref:hypothetical protein n=1 Tax=Streptomyces sp. NA04227 TaxID=2742136 RepID=UPI001591567B|nr:hypothetical protein [Streptomyces sp. NA04227]QKW09208.1 hypothetical protein HUT18_25350 [Streptomyces sp. NA04227]